MSDWDRSSKPRSFSPWLLLVFVGVMMVREYRSGFHNIGMIASISIAAGVLFFFLAPEKFSTPRRSKPEEVAAKARDAEANEQ